MKKLLVVNEISSELKINRSIKQVFDNTVNQYKKFNADCLVVVNVCGTGAFLADFLEKDGIPIERVYAVFLV